MKRLLATFLVLAGIAGVACYQDDVLHPPAIAPTKVFITDDPFPYDSVSSVNIYVTRIEASPRDTAPADRAAGRATWVEVAAPRKRFDLLTLQQGAKELLGEGTLDAGQYTEIRMTINVDSSSIKYPDGSDAIVHWPSPGQGEIFADAGVGGQLAISGTGAEIVVDFDVGRSFLYRLFGTKEFYSQPVIRAVNSAATGAIAGTVTAANIVGPPSPVANANITVYSGDPSQFSSQWAIVATGRSDEQGRYKIAYLLAGGYIVRVEQPDIPAYVPVTSPNVQVTVGGETSHSVFLPLAGAGSAFLHISAATTTVGVYGSIVVHAAVGDSNGIPEANPDVTWHIRDSTVAGVAPDTPFVADSLSNVIVWGVKPGTTWLLASSGTLEDSLELQVIDQPPPPVVASVTVTPSTLNLAVGDSVGLTAVLRDSSGNVVNNETVDWQLLLGADTTKIVVNLFPFGLQALVKAKQIGSATVRAVEPNHGAHSDVPITVH